MEAYTPHDCRHCERWTMLPTSVSRGLCGLSIDIAGHVPPAYFSGSSYPSLTTFGVVTTAVSQCPNFRPRETVDPTH